MVFVVILTVYLLVVDMLNVFSEVSGMGFSAYGVGVMKTFVFLTCRTHSELVPNSLQNVFHKLLVFQLHATWTKKWAHIPLYGPILWYPLICSSILYPWGTPFELVGHCIGQWHYNGGECRGGLKCNISRFLCTKIAMKWRVATQQKVLPKSLKFSLRDCVDDIPRCATHFHILNHLMAMGVNVQLYVDLDFLCCLHTKICKPYLFDKKT